jgi:hypothetical protein
MPSEVTVVIPSYNGARRLARANPSGWERVGPRFRSIVGAKH